MALISMALINDLFFFLMNYDFPFDSFEVGRNWWLWYRILGFRHVGGVFKDLRVGCLSIIKEPHVPNQHLHFPEMQ